jgi:hypothetical protein
MSLEGLAGGFLVNFGAFTRVLVSYHHKSPVRITYIESE